MSEIPVAPPRKSLDSMPQPLPRTRSMRKARKMEPIFETSSLTPSEIAEMSARAIAAARSRTAENSRPISAYAAAENGNPAENGRSLRKSEKNRRRASIAVLPMERTLSPEFGAIRVQVEDITTNAENLHLEADLDETETSTETIVQQEDQDLENSRKSEEMISWAVPSEYATSPIVEALEESRIEERPPPKIPAIYMNLGEESADDGNYSDFVIRRNSSTNFSQNSTTSANSVTLLEQIIRTHAIWYLPHLGRPEVLHLLKRMEPGNFIVRASTRENCMALSMRLPQASGMETDHYIIEKIHVPGNLTNVVRLEGSPRTFRSLPLLIEHYCVNDEELLIRLQLPAAIRNCTTTKQLQSISLMQQDFWTSDMSLSRRKPSRSLSRCSMASTDTLRKMETASTWFMNNSPAENESTVGGKIEDLKNNNKMPLPKKRSNSRSSLSNSRFATVCVGDFQSGASGEDETDFCGFTGYSRPDVETSPSISRIDRRSQSVRSHKSVTSTQSTTSTVTSRASRPRSFLRSLLSFGSKESPGIAKKQIDSTPQEYFAPWDQGFGRQVRSSRSAFDITQPPPQGFLAAPKIPSKSNFDDENYTKGWRQDSDVKKSPGSRSNRSESMKTFKPIYDVPSASSSNSPNLRPLTLRQSGVSLENMNGQRLAFHNESSPGPARIPMTPPANGNDPQTIRNCVEELRRKRLQSTNEMLLQPYNTNSSNSANSTPLISMRRRNNGQKTSFAGIQKQKSDHRLSVPNLIAATNPLIPRQDEQMTTINEGLVTPLVRRKMFISAQKSAENRNSKMIAEVEGVCVEAGEVAKRREVLEALIDRRKQTSGDKRIPSSSSSNSTSSTSSGGAESELIWRQRAAAASHPHPHPKIVAKVLPTPQARQRQISAAAMISLAACDSSTASSASDYAQLADFDAARRKFAAASSAEIEDDTLSVAGTVFNEPWDSNVWENLLDLAHHGDQQTNETGIKLSDAIQEESDNAMDSEEDSEAEDVDIEMPWPENHARKLPSDRVTVKGWDAQAPKYSTLDSRGGSRREETYSVKSLPRTLSRYSGSTGNIGASFGSIDDLPTTLPASCCCSPVLGMRRAGSSVGTTSQKNVNAHAQGQGIGKNVQNYVEQLAQILHGSNACFGQTLRQFIQCTKDTKETDPSIVVRNVRQFINGMKNYLVKHGEGDLHQIIDEESARLNSNQILNIDAVLEAILHKLLLKEVKPLLYHVMIKEHSKNGHLQMISTNIGMVRKLTLKQMGFSNSEKLIPPSSSTLEQVKLYMRKMQGHYSPLKKLENLMKSVSLILATCQNQEIEENGEGADDLVRWLVYILARTSTVGCEVEAWYMWELLPQPILMQSAASFYLTALFSAVHVFKSAEAIKRLCENRDAPILSPNSEPFRTCSPLLSTATLTRGKGLAQAQAQPGFQAFVKIAIPDETQGCVRYATFPGVPMLTTNKLSRLIAHQQGITNPEEHGLYLIADGFESCLQPNDCPVQIHEQLKCEQKPHLFAYKRHEAKIAWPRTAF
ncbi:unnamed protein product [Caenorhabditis angaria]|uniref:Protein sprint n=1 Tax=Caenorhabditis angaria TaxID=860376 RepID=A0A9P1IQI0_9PELO|nr:unnamed protein product [Caenorhabditis angaria]